MRWRWIKIRFSKSIPNSEPRSPVREARGERGIWQRRYWEHLIRDDKDLSNHIDYCWFNPVKHGHDANAEEWPYSTFHRDHCDAPKPGEFERKCAEYAMANRDAQFGERS